MLHNSYAKNLSVPLFPDKEMDQEAAGLRTQLHPSARPRRRAADD